ncbi:hypothetical protein Bbelb_030020 [Branchiostoma belcheri]|nr:hypothetical protein Bbelb_030020 [Branchiostoma belcheri]
MRYLQCITLIIKSVPSSDNLQKAVATMPRGHIRQDYPVDRSSKQLQTLRPRTLQSADLCCESGWRFWQHGRTKDGGISRESWQQMDTVLPEIGVVKLAEAARRINRLDTSTPHGSRQPCLSGALPQNGQDGSLTTLSLRPDIGLSAERAPIDRRSRHHYLCALTALSVRSHGAICALSRRYLCALTALSVRSHGAICALSRRYLCALTALSVRSHGAICALSWRSLCGHCWIAVLGALTAMFQTVALSVRSHGDLGALSALSSRSGHF